MTMMETTVISMGHFAFLDPPSMGWARYDPRNTVDDYIQAGYEFLHVRSSMLITDMIISGEYPLEAGGFVMERKRGTLEPRRRPLPFKLNMWRYTDAGDGYCED